MIAFDKSAGQKIHGRTIAVSTYEYDQESIVVEGRLTDTRFQKTYYLDGKSRPPGIVHDMVVRMRVKGPELIIKDIEVEMETVPREECRKTLNSLIPIKGMKIRSGFTGRVKAAVGGARGCSHLVELLLAMAPAAVQGAWTAVAAKPIDSSKLSGNALAFLDNTCWVWRSNGSLMQELKTKIGGGKT
ncbi:MAG: DUF2889 domain-containing protein [Deltaproteobacteria bacterium]|nr:DUF2889 domain-containing protein [Deltaproteobacteria bacterium]